VKAGTWRAGEADTPDGRHGLAGVLMRGQDLTGSIAAGQDLAGRLCLTGARRCIYIAGPEVVPRITTT